MLNMTCAVRGDAHIACYTKCVFNSKGSDGSGSPYIDLLDQDASACSAVAPTG